VTGDQAAVDRLVDAMRRAATEIAAVERSA
jgi:hypothetical protein